MSNKSDLSTYNNDGYYPGSLIRRVLWYVVNLIFFQTSFPVPVSIKVFILRLFGASVGKHIVIKPNVNIKYPWFLNVADNVWIGENVWIDNLAEVFIGSNVVLSQGALLICENHNYKKTSFDLILGKITLEDGTWICAKSTVGPNVTVHSHAILAIGSVATNDLEAWGIYRGNPAKRVSTRNIVS